MKKYLLMIVAFVGLMATSCAKDEGYVTSEPTVSITITTPDLQTRYGEGVEATELHWEVYVGDTHLVELDGSKSFTGQTTIDLRLVENKKYNLLFWAESPNQDIYTFANRKLTIDVSKLEANQESYDAFYAYEKDFVASSKVVETIELHRPFAQLNIATEDDGASSSAGINVSKTQVELNAYTEMNLVTGEVSGKQSLTYTMADRASGRINIGQHQYEMLSMNYLLVNGKDVSDVKFTAYNGTDNIVREFSLVPFERNHRTYIIGSLLTTSVGFKIVVVPDFDDPDNVVE